MAVCSLTIRHVNEWFQFIKYISNHTHRILYSTKSIECCQNSGHKSGSVWETFSFKIEETLLNIKDPWRTHTMKILDSDTFRDQDSSLSTSSSRMLSSTNSITKTHNRHNIPCRRTRRTPLKVQDFIPRKVDSTPRPEMCGGVRLLTTFLGNPGASKVFRSGHDCRRPVVLFLLFVAKKHYVRNI